MLVRLLNLLSETLKGDNIEVKNEKKDTYALKKGHSI